MVVVLLRAKVRLRMEDDTQPIQKEEFEKCFCFTSPIAKVELCVVDVGVVSGSLAGHGDGIGMVRIGIAADMVCLFAVVCIVSDFVPD